MSEQGDYFEGYDVKTYIKRLSIKDNMSKNHRNL